MRRFKVPNRDQLMLLPPSLHDLVRKDHPARFVVQFVSASDTTKFYERYKETADGQPPFDPAMMIAVFLYANMIGVYSSRKIERLIEDDLGFRFIVSDLRPDHRTIANFRRRHADDLNGLFRESVRLALKAQFVSLNHVCIDGTKIAANASEDQRKTMQALESEIKELEARPEIFLNRAEQEDRAEDAEFGNERNPYLLPKHLQEKEALDAFIKEELSKDKDDSDDQKPTGPKPQTTGIDENKASKKMRRRLEQLRKAQKALEEKERLRKEQDPTGKRERDAQRKRGGKPHEARINVTDPESRTMLMRGRPFTDGYNGQIVVDADFGIIVAAEMVQDENDIRQLTPMLNQVRANTGFNPANVSADSGYFNGDQIDQFHGVEFYIPPKRRANNESPFSRAERMREKLESELGRSIYNIRKTVVEPVFGTIKNARNYRHTLCRGKKMVNAEWQILCTAHNLLRMWKLSPTLS